MRVEIDLSDAAISVGKKGLLLAVSDNAGKLIGHLRIGPTGMEWRRGTSLVGRAKKIPLQQVIAVLQDLAPPGPSTASMPPAVMDTSSRSTPRAKKQSGSPQRTPVRTRGRSSRSLDAAPAGRIGPRRGRTRKLDTRVVRAWAQEQGLEVADRGRVSGSVIDQYRKAHR